MPLENFIISSFQLMICVSNTRTNFLNIIIISAVRGFVGHFEESGLIPVPHVERCYLWSSLHFTFTYNDDHIISANVSTSKTLPIALDEHVGDFKVEFSYSGMRVHNLK